MPILVALWLHMYKEIGQNWQQYYGITGIVDILPVTKLQYMHVCV